MKNPFRSHILPRFTIIAGGLGFVLRLWLFAAIDEKMLLPVKHFADSATYILTALVFIVLFLSTRKLIPRQINKQLSGTVSALAYLLGAIGLIANGLISLSSSNVRLAVLATVASILGSVIMLCIALLKYLRRKLPYWMPALLTAALILCTIAQCQVWGAESQLQVYFFPLMASVFLILTAYHKTRLAANLGRARQLAFFSQGALYLCCLSLNNAQWPFYFAMLFWAAMQLYPCLRAKRRRSI